MEAPTVGFVGRESWVRAVYEGTISAATYRASPSEVYLIYNDSGAPGPLKCVKHWPKSKTSKSIPKGNDFTYLGVQVETD